MTCTECDQPVRARGLCGRHYSKARRSGAIGVVQVRGLPLAERFEHYVDRSGGPDACHPWRGRRHKQGYGQFVVDRGGERWKTQIASRVAWEIEHGEQPPSDLMVCHSCDNPPCQNPRHLFLGTSQDNDHDSGAKGRKVAPIARAHGERNGNAKLTQEVVEAIRTEYATTRVSQKDLGLKYSINQTTISRVLRGTTWKR